MARGGRTLEKRRPEEPEENDRLKRSKIGESDGSSLDAVKNKAKNPERSENGIEGNRPKEFTEPGGPRERRKNGENENEKIQPRRDEPDEVQETLDKAWEARSKEFTEEETKTRFGEYFNAKRKSKKAESTAKFEEGKADFAKERADSKAKKAEELEADSKAAEVRVKEAGSKEEAEKAEIEAEKAKEEAEKAKEEARKAKEEAEKQKEEARKARKEATRKKEILDDVNKFKQEGSMAFAMGAGNMEPQSPDDEILHQS